MVVVFKEFLGIMYNSIIEFCFKNKDVVLNNIESFVK